LLTLTETVESGKAYSPFIYNDLAEGAKMSHSYNSASAWGPEKKKVATRKPSWGGLYR